jgi:hypothetical protein
MVAARGGSGSRAVTWSLHHLRDSDASIDEVILLIQ